jgi:hypothetical protein
VSLGIVLIKFSGLSTIGFSKSVTLKKGVAVDIINDIKVMPAMAKN